jgi:tetratricopeptide (TPR) repeat protein
MRIQFPSLLGMQGISQVKQEREVLLSILDQLSWVQAGEASGFDKQKDFLQTLDLSRNFILTNYTVGKLVNEKSQPSDDEVKAYYQDNIDQYHVVAPAQISHILLATRAQAEDVRRQALAGQDFAVLAGKFSLDQDSRGAGGSIGTISLVSPVRGYSEGNSLNQQIMALKAGEISAPIQTTRGWSLFKVNTKSEEQNQPLDEVRESIQKRLMVKKSNDLYSTVLNEAKKQYHAAIDEDAWMRYAVTTLSDDDALQLAQMEKNPRTRQRWFDTMIAIHPQGAKAAQAYFMAGFTCADDLRDYAKAREYFQKILDKFPQSELVPSAKWMMENMEKGLENLPYAEQLKRKAVGG